MNDYPLQAQNNSMVFLAEAKSLIPKDTHITGVVSLPSVLDGPIVNATYRNLIVDAGATLTVSSRCKGLIITCYGDCTIYGAITMTARGCSAIGEIVPINIATSTVFAVQFPNDINALKNYMLNFFTSLSSFSDLPSSIALTASKVVTASQSLTSVPAIGAGAGSGVYNTAGTDGVAGTNRQCGGGGGGGSWGGTSSAGGAGTSFSGGTGGGAVGNSAGAGIGSSTGGAGGFGTGFGGGGAGNPGGAGGASDVAGDAGTGGLLILIVLGTLTVSTSGSITSIGSSGGLSLNSHTGGGCSGGGSVNIAYKTAYVNSGTVSAAGGTTRTFPACTYRGGNGGAGCVTVDHLT